MWIHLPRTFLAVAALMSVNVESTADSAADYGAATPPLVELVRMPPEFAAAVEWAIDLFHQAGLELPPLRYVFHGESPAPCADRLGLHHFIDGVNVIEICASEMTTPTKVMVLHETAHAWIDHTLTDERRAAFQQLRGWTYWRDYDAAAWHENGTEQAAEIMVWGLIDRPLKMVRINQNSCEELDAGYRTLTGQAPAKGYRDEC